MSSNSCKKMRQTSTCPKLPRKTNCPNSAHVLQFPSQCKSAITMATSLPTTMPCKTQSRQRCSEHGHTKKMAQWASNHNRDWSRGTNVSMLYNASAKTQVPPNSSENESPFNILDNSQHMPEDIHQSKPKLWTLKHHAETFQILQFKPNDIQLNKSWRLSN